MSGTIVQRSGGYSPKITIAGKQIWIATFPKKELATASLEQVAKSPFPTYTFAELADEYGRRHSVKPSTHAHNADMLRSFVRANGRRPVASYLRFEAVKWANRNPSRVRYVRSLFAYAISLGIVEENPFVGLRTAKRPAETVLPTMKQIEHAASCAESVHEGDKGALVRDLVLTAVSTGLRLSELVSLLDENVVDIEDGLELHVVGKGGRFRVVPVTGSAVDVIARRRDRRLLFEFRGRQLDRRDIHRLWKPVREEAGIPDANWHVLRKVYASSLADAGVEDRDAAMVVHGHRDPRLLRDVYSHPDRRKAVERVRRTIDG